ncbi:MAG: T9SS type A sorting domain-containing protein [Chitinophagaceae bacterium]|nr:T9SS type A sorting domain-containing protein [Chitinophagaceae bacterium]MCB9045531.1 T9SS type A sorting domain-containing protein [Chitinophagales bacterium]
MEKQLLSTTHMHRYLNYFSCFVLMFFISIKAFAIPPSITAQPANTSACAPATIAFVVNASNTTSYQWQVNDGGGFVNVVNGGVYSGATTNVLHLNSAPASMDGYLYRCIATGPDAPAAISNSATLNVYTQAVITTEPAISTTVCDGDNVNYTVTATGSGLSYQWYTYVSGSAVPITNGGIYSGATTATLTITGITTGVNTTTYQYHCIVTGTCNLDATNTLLLNVKAKPTITSNPVNVTVCSGDDASFEVSATGPNRTFQWQVSYNGVNWANLTNSGGYSNVTTSKMTVTSIPSMHGSKYRCVVSADCPPQAISAFATLSVNNTLNITTQPVNSTICPGTGASFFVTATGTNLSYQWQVLPGGAGTWTNLANAGIYSGVTTNILHLTNVTAAYNNNWYRCVVNGDCSPATPSNPGVLTLYSPVVITGQPAVSSTICSGGNKTYTVTATGSGLTYQWYRKNGASNDPITNGGIYSGATTPTLQITGITTGSSASTYQYHCIVTGTCNIASTNTLLLNVNALPAVVTDPIDETTCSGNDAFFDVSATGTNLTYQWQVSYNSGNWANLTNTGGYVNVTTPNMKVTTSQSLNGTKYRCVVSGACTPPDTSASALLTIYAPLTITSQPGNDTICPGGSTSFRVLATGGSGLTYQWQVSTNGGSNWNNVTNGGVYANATTNMLGVSNVTTGMNNYLYRCLIDELCSPVLISGSGRLNVYNPAVITAEPPKNTTICSGGNVVYGVKATGAGLSYQWYVHNGLTNIPLTNGGIYSGATTDTLRITGITAAPSAATKEYHCLVTGTCNTASTQTLILNINALPAITSNPVNDTACAGNDASFAITETGTGTTYQWQVSYNGTTWTNLANTGGYTNVTTREMKVTTINGMDGSMYRCVVSGTCTPPAISASAKLKVYSPLAIITQPSNEGVCPGGSTAFVVVADGTDLTYQWQVHNGTNWTNLTNTGVYSGATTSVLTLSNLTPANNNGRYRCIVNGKCSLPTTSGEGHLDVYTPVAITNSGSIPVNTTICSGGSMSYTVNVTGSNPTYQWYVNNGTGYVPVANGGIYSGATSATLYISGITTNVTATTRHYHCIVTGPCNTASTNTLHLTINALPVITSQPVNSTICEGGSANYSITATGTAISYQWQFHNGTAWTNITNGGIYSNATTNTLAIVGAGASLNNTPYRCVVSGACTPPVSSASARLYINTAPVVIQSPYSSTICSGDNTSFTIAAIGTAPTYQWQVDNGSGWMNVTNGGIYSNATTATLNLTAVTTAVNGYKYRCVVSGTCSPTATSAAGTLTVNQPTVITANPVDKTICENQTASFEVAATGKTLTYQWQEFNGSSWANIANAGSYSGANTNKLVMVYIGASKNGYKYRCIVGGACAPLSVTSAEAVLTVNSYVVITTQPSSTAVCSGGNTSLSVSATGTGISYQWYGYNGTSFQPLSNTGNYSGVTTATLGISGLTATTTATYTYYCRLIGACNSLSTNTTIITVNTLPVVTSSPANVTVCDSSDNITFSAAGTGTGLTYQWQEDNGTGWTNLSNGTNVAGATTNTLLLKKVSVAMSANQYRCVLSGTCSPGATSGAATLTVNPLVVPSVSISASATNICAGTLVTCTATPVNGGATPTYQWTVKGVNVGTNNAAYTTTSLADLDYVACNMVTSHACPTRTDVNSNVVTMHVTSYQTPTATVMSVAGDTVCSGIMDTFNVTTTYGGAAPTYQWQVNGVDVASTSNSYATDSLKNGDAVRCILTSNFMCPTSATVSSNNVDMVVNQTTLATVSIAGSADTNVCDGKMVTFTAAGTNGGASPAYQWIRNGKDLFGETNQTYSVANLQSNDVLACRYTSSAECVFPVESDTLHITVDQPVAATVDLKVSYNGNNSYTFTAIPVNGGTSPTYQWDLNGTTVQGVTGPVYTTDQLIVTDKIRVMMTSSHPCVISQNVFSRRVTTGIGGQESLVGDLKLYPNPNNGKFIISGEYEGVGIETAKITIVNAMGQLIHTSEAQIISGKLQHEVSLNGDPASGMYMMRIELNGKQDIRRFTITK